MNQYTWIRIVLLGICHKYLIIDIWTSLKTNLIAHTAWHQWMQFVKVAPLLFKRFTVISIWTKSSYMCALSKGPVCEYVTAYNFLFIFDVSVQTFYENYASICVWVDTISKYEIVTFYLKLEELSILDAASQESYYSLNFIELRCAKYCQTENTGGESNENISLHYERISYWYQLSHYYVLLYTITFLSLKI